MAPDWWIARGLRSAAATATGMRRTNWLQSEYETLSGYQKQPEILGLSKGNICSAKALVGLSLADAVKQTALHC